jgi:hypothetical protein
VLFKTIASVSLTSVRLGDHLLRVFPDPEKKGDEQAAEAGAQASVLGPVLLREQASREALHLLYEKRVADTPDDWRAIRSRSPWQNPFVERVIGAVRRECLDHVIVWNERSLRRHLQQYLTYYHEWRTHLSLDKDAPVPRAVQPPTCGTIVQVPHLGGLHHHYERRAA